MVSSPVVLSSELEDPSRSNTPLASQFSSAAPPQIPLPAAFSPLSIEDFAPSDPSSSPPSPELLHHSAPAQLLHPSAPAPLLQPDRPLLASKSKSSLTFVDLVLDGSPPDAADPVSTAPAPTDGTPSDGRASDLSAREVTPATTTDTIQGPPSGPFMLPIRPPVSGGSQSSLTFSDVVDDGGNLDTLPPEIAAADIAIAPDGSFVETSSGPAAFELKRRYDQKYGVNATVRSPYAITAFVNQHGKQMFRVGRRELSAPATSGVEAEERMAQSKSSISSSEASQSPRNKRLSRMSMHLIPPSMFTKTSSTSTSGGNSGRTARPQTAAAPPSRKLRKTRSIPDMVSLSVGSAQVAGPTTTLTGRAHSHSVTAADIAPFATVPSRTGGVAASAAAAPTASGWDMFGDLMAWSVPATSASTSFSTHSLSALPRVDGAPMPVYDLGTQHSRAIIPHPFGVGVSFDSPSRKSAVDFLPTPRLLREMQSFESGLTARQVDAPGSAASTASPADANSPEGENSRPASAIRIRTSVASLSTTAGAESTGMPSSVTAEVDGDGEIASEPTYAPSPEAAMHSHFSPDVFDVLQTYRGLPLLEKLSPESEGTTVIKLSLSTDDSAAPRNDPRFVIWGEIQPEWDRRDEFSASRDSIAELAPSAQGTSLSKRRSSKVSKAAARAAVEPPPALHLSSGEPGETQRVLVAATIERWIGQLTSVLDYDELLDFFLTYRTYVSGVDLCHLLISRFHWALQQPTSLHDEKVRRIVRVRTFVAIRYWLVTFFTVDFLPDRDLRRLLADWLNVLIRDPVLKKSSDGLNIVRSLVKVAKDCKRIHTRTATEPKPNKNPPKPTNHVLGEKFAEATRKPFTNDNDSDLDLDFIAEETTIVDPPIGFKSDPANAHLSSAHVGARFSANRPVSLPPATLGILHRTEHAPGPATQAETPFIQTAATLPVHHSALSRAFVKTIGRLGRWKRVLNSRSASRASLAACADVSAFDLELSASRDLLTVNGGVEQYLKMIEPQASTSAQTPRVQPAQSPPKRQTTVITPVLYPTPPFPQPQSTLSKPAPLPPPLTLSQPSPPSSEPAEISTPTLAVPEPLAAVVAPIVNDPPTLLSDLSPGYKEPEADITSANPSSVPLSLGLEHGPSPADVDDEVEYGLDSSAGRPQSFQSTSTDSLGSPLGEGGMAPTFSHLATPWQFDVVSIDELDMSDTSSEAHVTAPAAPPGLRRPPRKLPLRREFEFVRRSEVSSMGIISHESMGSPTSSVPSTSSFTGLGPGIQQWQMNALIDSLSNDGESGDVEAALRRLEGQINPEKQQEKASKVDGWVRTIQERMAAGDYGDEEPRFSDDEDDDYEDQDAAEFDDQHESASQDGVSVSAPAISEPDEPFTEGSLESANTPVPTQTVHCIPPPPGLDSPRRGSDAPDPEDAVPMEILESRMPSGASVPAPVVEPSLTSKFGNPEAPRIHRSFILNVRAEILAQHFSMIDRELFMSVKFEELVLTDWLGCEEVNVLDWAQYLKDRARWKAESRFPEKTSALAAVRARFNLMANFVISEIVLTQPSERHMLVGKFIRVAWRSYTLSNFNTLTAIIAALQSDWVTRAMRRSGWSRLGMFEQRAFRDLKQFTANNDDFKFIRNAVESIVEKKPLDASSHAASVVSGGGTDQSGRGKVSGPPIPSACVPFIGIYLSQLYQLSKLPDLIDPTAPNEAVSIDPVSANFDPPAHPEVFSALAPLPSTMHLEPLINVHKQRRIAGVIKSLVAGQHLASHVQFEVDKRLFQKCLRLRGLDPETLQRALAMYPD